MAEIVGGLRNRFIKDSISLFIEDELGQLGWFDDGRRHAPVRFVSAPQDWEVAVEPNSIAVSMSPTVAYEAELGTQMVFDNHQVVVDVYAESDSFGVDITGDIREILRARMGSTGRRPYAIPLYDLGSAATPMPIGHLHVDPDSVQVDRTPSQFEKPYLQHWFVLSFIVEDVYSSAGAGYIGPPPPPCVCDDFLWELAADTAVASPSGFVQCQWSALDQGPVATGNGWITSPGGSAGMTLAMPEGSRRFRVDTQVETTAHFDTVLLGLYDGAGLFLLDQGDGTVSRHYFDKDGNFVDAGDVSGQLHSVAIEVNDTTISYIIDGDVFATESLVGGYSTVQLIYEALGRLIVQVVLSADALMGPVHFTCLD